MTRFRLNRFDGMTLPVAAGDPCLFVPLLVFVSSLGELCPLAINNMLSAGLRLGMSCSPPQTHSLVMMTVVV